MELKFCPQAILIFDNAPRHPAELASDVNILFLSSNLIQSMDTSYKIFYRKNVLKRIVDFDANVTQTLGNKNLRDGVSSLDKAMKHMNTNLLKKSF